MAPERAAGGEIVTRLRFSIAYFHRTLYTLGESADEPTKRAVLEPLFNENGVKVVLSGHMHGYERFEVNGTLALVSGGGGSPLDDVNAHLVDRPEIAAKRKFAAAAFHYLDIEIGSGILRGRAIGINGQPIDTFEWKVP